MKVKEESKKASLKLNIQQTKTMASVPITWWQIDAKTMETVRDFIFFCGGGAPKSLQIVTAAMKLKDTCSLEEKLWPNLVQFSAVAQSCLTLCNPMNHSMPGLPVHHKLLEFTQTHAHWVGEAIQPSEPLSSPSTPAPKPYQHQGLFQQVNSSHEVAKVLEFHLQYQSFQRTPRTDL